jgi:hypothetical protein
MMPSALLFSDIRCLECGMLVRGLAQFSWGALCGLDGFTFACPYEIGDAVRWTSEQPGEFRGKTFGLEIPDLVICGSPSLRTIDIGCELSDDSGLWHSCPKCGYRADHAGIYAGYAGVIRVVDNVFRAVEALHALNWRSDIVDTECLL